MKCAWKELLDILPPGFRQQVDVLGRETLQELRLRVGCAPLLVLQGGRKTLPGIVSGEQLKYVVNMACRYSPWTAESASRGYMTAKGGHRIGLCGEAVVKDGCVTAFGGIRSLNIRVARDFEGLARPLGGLQGNILLLGPPGSGKTTLLRDLIRQRAERETVAVADERGELFPDGVSVGAGVDILTGCGKPAAIEMLLKSMGPSTIAVDEITSAADCDALVQAGWCGVGLLATAHARDTADLLERRIYLPIVRSGLFDHAVVLKSDKSYKAERMKR